MGTFMKRLTLFVLPMAVIALALFAIWKFQDLSPKHHFELGRTALYQENYETAISHFSRVIQLDSSFSDIYLLRGACYQEQGQNEKALSDFDQHIRIRPNHAIGYRFRGDAHWAKRELDLALADYTRSIELDPSKARAYVERGAVFLEKKEYERALSSLEKALELDPGFARAYVDKGRVHRRKKEYRFAENCFLDAIKHDPESVDAYNNLAWLWATCPESGFRNGPKAVEFATRANELTSWEEPYCLDTLAAAYAEQGKYDEAIRWLKKAMEYPDAFEPEDLEKDRKALALYEAGKPYRDE
jgi:serine/threonine-protein kinase